MKLISILGMFIVQRLCNVLLLLKHIPSCIHLASKGHHRLRFSIRFCITPLLQLSGEITHWLRLARTLGLNMTRLCLVGAP